MPFTFEPTALEAAIIIIPRVFADERGFFLESFKKSEFEAAGLPGRFVQENHSQSARGILRGLHFQRAPKAQGKLVRVIAGEIFDVAVDVRPDSSTYLKWVGVTLSADNQRQFYIPPGCAHGFAVVSDEAQVIYKTTEEYAPELESGLRWDDPKLGITWPVGAPVVSGRDQNWPYLP